eukprot:GHUV01021626.1.p1 GENE.GHUV01021626.1~~GHUV01021626.1.p1  ORF type:complete len:166 (+),score=44.39 GHUV01021626.1:32-529(+)
MCAAGMLSTAPATLFSMPVPAGWCWPVSNVVCLPPLAMLCYLLQQGRSLTHKSLLSVVRRGQRREETFENVLRQQLAFPSKPVISPEAQDLITQLLIKDPAKRLGTRSGAEEIKKHPWFEGMNWALLRHQPPPYVPRRAQQQAAVAAGVNGAKPSVDSTGEFGNY